MSTKLDKNLEKAVIDTLKGVPELLVAAEYHKGFQAEMERQRQSALLFLLAKLYQDDFGALAADVPKAALLEPSYRFTRQDQQACLSMLLYGVEHLTHGDYSGIARLADEGDSFDFDMLPFW